MKMIWQLLSNDMGKKYARYVVGMVLGEIKRSRVEGVMEDEMVTRGVRKLVEIVEETCQQCPVYDSFVCVLRCLGR